LVRDVASQIGARGYVSKSTLARDLLPAIVKIIGSPGEDEDTSSIAVPENGSSRAEWLFGGGDLGHFIRQHDWSSTPLGPIGKWPQSLRTAVNLMLNSQHPMWIGWGPEMTFLYNDAYISVLSLAKHPGSLGRPAREVWAEIWDVCGPLANKVFERGEPSFANDVHLFMSRGEYLEETYYSFSYSPIYDESGKVGGLFCPSTETTAKVLHARRLRALAELSAKALVEKSVEAACLSCAGTISDNPDDIPFCLLYLLDHERQIATLAGTSRVSPGVERVSPLEISLHKDHSRSALWPIQEVIERSRARLVSLAGIDSLPLGAARQPVFEALVLPVTRPGYFPCAAVLIAGVNPTRKLDSEYNTFFSLVADQVAAAIQNATAAEEEKKRAGALAEIDQAKTQFFSNVSHEFRTPLTLMMGPLEDMLGETAGLAPEQRERLDVAHRNSLRLLKLVNTLLDFSRIETGRIQATYEATDLALLTAELASVFRSMIERAGMKLIVNCSPLEQTTYVDREMWEKIVFNLVSNAFKFTFEGEIEVSLAGTDGFAELSVRDTGTGIPAEELPHVFKRFHRVKNARGRTIEGSGIGLALVEELTKLHGGTVHVESQLDCGSKFTVRIPCGEAHLPADRVGAGRGVSTAPIGNAFLEEAELWLPETSASPAPLSAEASGIPASTPVGQARVLIADDNADMRDYVRRLLSGYQVVLAADGEAALESALKNPPDLVLTDVMMPSLDGFGLLRRLRSDERTATIPVILLSARAGDDSRLEAMAAGADDYLVKPFSARELRARVETNLKLSRLRGEAAERERALRVEAERNEHQFRAIVETTPECVKLVAPDGTVLHINESGMAMYEASCAEMMVGKNIYDLIAPEHREHYRQFNERICRGEKGVLQFDIVGLQGTRRHMDTHAAPLRQSDGTLVHLAVTRDVTNRKRAEERERRITSEAIAATAKFRAVFEQTTVFAGIMSKDGVMIEANKLCLEACGYRAEQVLGRPFCETEWWRNFPESQDKIRAATPRAAEGVPYRETLRYSWADGTERLVDFALYPILDDDGKVLFLHPTGVDITDLKRTEENYRQLAETLDSQVRARTRELEERSAEVLEQSEQLRELSWQLLHTQDEERRRIARELHDSAGQILAILGLNLSTLVEGARQLAPEFAQSAKDAEELVQQLTKEIRTTSYLLHPPLLDENGLPAALSWYIRGLTERSSLDISFKISEEFGRLPREMELVLFRLVQECLTNIHRHSGSKSAVVQMFREGDKVVVEVRDRGRGISPQKLAEIQSKGSGVGIRGMRERLRQFRGEMAIKSSNAGTLVRVSLPAPPHERGAGRNATSAPHPTV
jgi:PAS domain S-box-containing protein